MKTKNTMEQSLGRLLELSCDSLQIAERIECHSPETSRAKTEALLSASHVLRSASRQIRRHSEMLRSQAYLRHW